MSDRIYDKPVRSDGEEMANALSSWLGIGYDDPDVKRVEFEKRLWAVVKAMRKLQELKADAPQVPMDAERIQELFLEHLKDYTLLFEITRDSQAILKLMDKIEKASK